MMELWIVAAGTTGSMNDQVQEMIESGNIEHRIAGLFLGFGACLQCTSKSQMGLIWFETKLIPSLIQIEHSAR